MSPRGEHGFTLVELLTALFVGSIVVMGVFGLLDATVRSHGETASRMAATREGRLVVERVTQQLRLANCPEDGGLAVVAAADDRITFHTTRPQNDYALAVPDELRTLRVEPAAQGSRIVLEVAARGPGAAAYVAQPAETRVLAERIARDASAPVFSFLPYLSPTAPDVGEPLPTPVTTSGLLAQIAQVRVRFVALPPAGDATDPRGARYDDRVVLRLDDPTDDDPGTEC